MFLKGNIRYALTAVFFFLLVFGHAQYIPPEVPEPICDGQSISVGAPGNSGFYSITIPCNTWQPLSPYLDFYHVVIQSGTTFTFLVEPVGNDDYDFGAWKNPNWNNLNATPTSDIRGSQNDPNQTGIFHLGLSLTATDLCEPGGSTGHPEPGMVRYFDVQPGDEILIAIDRWSQTSLGYTISFGGDAELDCTILGNAYGKCDLDENDTATFDLSELLPDLEDEFPNHVFKFYNNQNSAETGSGTQVNFPYNITYNDGEPTELFARVETQAGNFVRVVKIFLFVNKPPELLTDSTELPKLCPENNDGQATFDLTLAEPDLVIGSDDFIFKYYLTYADAVAGGNNNIPNPTAYLSGETILYVRVETGPLNGNEEGCFDVAEVHLKISDFDAESKDLDPINICVTTGGNTVGVDLTESEPNLVDNPANYQFFYFLNPIDAMSGTNPIPNPENYEVAVGQTTSFYVRVESQDGICFVVSTIKYHPSPGPQLNELSDISLCADEGGEILYDLTEFDNQVVNGAQNYDISYYESMANAVAGQNPIPQPGAYPIPANSDITVYIRVESPECFSIAEVDIIVGSNPNVIDLDEQEFCAPQENGTFPIDLTQYEPDWVNNPNDYNITYHTSQQNAETGANPILNPETYQVQIGVTNTIYIRIIDLVGECYKTTILTLVPGAAVELDGNFQISLCDDNFDGVFQYDLTDLNPMLSNNFNNITFSYYPTENDAINDQNAVPQGQWQNYTFNIIPSSIWVVGRISQNCPSIPVKVDFVQGAEIQIIQDELMLSFCENDLIDLNEYELEISTENNVIFSYHSSLADAQNNLNPIPNTSEFNPEELNLIYVRLEKEGRCPNLAIIHLDLREAPGLELSHSDFKLCPGDMVEVFAETDASNAVFEWLVNGEFTDVGSEFLITEPGVYTVIVKDEFDCYNEKTIVVEPMGTPVITGVEMGLDYVIVSAGSAEGGYLEYSLDGVLWQDSPRFDHLIPGETYIVYVREDGCMMESYEFSLLFVTNVITPNNDGINDTWKPRGVQAGADAIIRIFDRYGKIFVETNFNENYEWNGKYMGNNVPSGDYWYIIEIPTGNDTPALKYLGHISVRSR